MRKAYEYSHLGGAEILQLRYPAVNAAIDEAIATATGNFRTKIGAEKTNAGQALYSPKEINRALAQRFQELGFKELRRTVPPRVPGLDTSRIRAGFKQIDFAKDRVLVEVQLGKYFAMFYDMAKLEYFYRENEADVGVEIVPSHDLQQLMSTGVGRGEMLITDIEGLRRSFPTLPIKVILIEPDDL